MNALGGSATSDLPKSLSGVTLVELKDVCVSSDVK